jgi:hypothetical protein
MENNNNHDKYFRELLSGSSREMPFSDFEEELMSEIGREHEKKNSITRNIKLSWLFFILGLVSGITLAVVTPRLTEGSAALQGDLMYAAIILICLFIILFAEKLLRISFPRYN